MDISLDARCFEGYYGLNGEYCAQCWNYIQRHPNIPDAIETVYAAECHATYDRLVGTSEPVANQGFSILPPNACQNGGCKTESKCCLDAFCEYKDMTPAMIQSFTEDDCSEAGGVWVNDIPSGYNTIPQECLGNSEEENIELDLICAKATRPGNGGVVVFGDGTSKEMEGGCHPTRVKGHIKLNDGKNWTGGPMKANREVCPHIMPCEPPHSCDKGGV